MSIPEECTSYVKSVQSELQKTQDDLQLAESHLKTAQKKFTHENDKLQIQIQTLKKKILRLEQARGAEGFRQQQKMNSLSYKHSDVIDAFVKLTSEYENYLQYFEERLATYNRILDLLKNQKQKITRDNIMYHIFNTAPEDPGPTLEKYKTKDETKRETFKGKIVEIKEEITQRSLAWSTILTLSMGAVRVLLTAPATLPAERNGDMQNVAHGKVATHSHGS